MKKVLRNIFLNPPLFFAGGAIVAVFALAYFFPFLFFFAQLGLLLLLGLLIVDIILLFNTKHAVFARRELPERLSNGDENPLSIYLQNFYSFPVSVEVIDELPFQFQKRDFSVDLRLKPRETKTVNYALRPTKRGVYSFGAVNLLVASPLRLLRRKISYGEGAEVPVYPSFLQMRQYELMAIHNRLNELGIKKIRKIGHSMEFEQIRDYVKGDDIRTINWKATARRGSYMVNQFQDEKAQPVYSVVDKGRLMRSPFEGLTLLDYAINASLVISNIAIRKEDKAGLITFSDKIGNIIPADRRPSQMFQILETLYNQKTRFLESDYERLYIHLRRKITQRSLMLLYTNFETLAGLRRQLPYLRKISRDHLLVVIFFENTEVRQLLEAPAKNTEQVYVKALGEKFVLEKRQIVKELERHGIQAVLTRPADLSVNTINKYLELKARGMI